ncbi:Protein FAM65B [Liparis tanakae]|uniref:Rho family-interacting cell polarization regulator 2 n=1 Tax=Liparis tanakae TaxID=230148 RepID=A0A4Z2H887_9TELE|nr:Protein FAM65B [Liparis tanakae]
MRRSLRRRSPALLTSSLRCSWYGRKGTSPLGGVSSRVPEIMAAGTHSPGGPNGIIRSQSFAGFSTLQERRSREYLEVHQTELDKLMCLMKDMKRNSRLGVLYDLDKQIKTIERYMRRLEFHMSKVDELYEAFCIQSRLRDGASRMKQAFSSSPSTKGTKESIAEVNRRYKEYTENMSTFESELENLLGEFHIKMKGEETCQIFMRYGRQRWKLKGRIEVNSRQSWDGDEMVFMPLITDLINIKVTELKGLASHMLVGSVICETKELFTAMPQVVAVDVNDLGTIKLNLEVTWYPFDVEDLSLSSGNVSKATALQRRVSVYSQGTPDTPTFQDASFFSTLPDDVFENGGCGVAECKRLSFTFSDTSGSTPSPAPSTHSQGPSNPEITVTPPEMDLSPTQILPTREDSIIEEHLVEEEEEDEEEYEEDEETGSRGSRGTSASLASDEAEVAEDSEWERTESQRNSSSNCGSAVPSLCSDGHLSTVAPEDVFLDHADELKPLELDTEEEGSLTRQLVKRLTSSDVAPSSEREEEEGGGHLSWAGEGSRAFLESSLEEAIHSLLMRLESLNHRCRELQDLEQEVMRLEDLLKCRLPGHRSRSSSLSLTVESALESFDFLNTSDFDDEDTGDDHMVLSTPPQRSPLFDTDAERIGGLGAWQRRSLLLKLSGQVELLEELAELSVDKLGAITSSADVIGVVVSEMVDRSDLVESHSPTAAELSQDVLTVFQFHSYIVQHEVLDMETHLLHLAREGGAKGRHPQPVCHRVIMITHNTI